MSPQEIDAVTELNFPLIAAPASGELSAPERHGTRYVVGKHGLFWELSTAWLYTVQRAAVPLARVPFGARPTPYGDIDESVRLLCSTPPKHLWGEFLLHARAALPNEAAALLIWNHVTDTWRLALRTATEVSADRIAYVNPSLEDDEVAVIDVHTHGTARAFFSGEDDADDAGGIKIAVVFGNVDRERPEMVARLVCVDRYIPLWMDQSGAFNVKTEGA